MIERNVDLSISNQQSTLLRRLYSYREPEMTGIFFEVVAVC